MLKTMFLRQKIDRKKQELDELRSKSEEFAKREEELGTAIENAATEEEQKAVEAEIDQFDADKSAHEEALSGLTREIEELEQELSEEESKAPETTKEERKNNMEINVRMLPANKRVFDALPLESRNAILAQEDVKSFLCELRSMKGQTRAISGGGLTIPTVLLDLIAENQYRYSKLMNRVRVRPVAGEARQTIAGLVPEAVWTEMCGNINELNFAFNAITLDGYKVAGYVPVCNALLEDNDVNLAGYIVEMLSEAIGIAKDKAILYGKGAAEHMPLGIVTRLAQESQPAGYPSSAPAWTDLHETNIISIAANRTGVEFWSALQIACGNAFTRYNRGTQFWAMNSKTYALLKSKAITFTASGDVVANVYGTLPIVNGDIDILEFMADGDIVGGYGDLYLWGQRSSMVIDESREVQFLQDNTVFRGRERADGYPVIAGAFVAININGQNPVTSMTFAGDNANTVSGIVIPSAATVAVGATLALNPTVLPFGVKAALTYTSATTAKATVSSAGVVTGVASGSSVITVSEAGGKSATCTVTVVTA